MLVIRLAQRSDLDAIVQLAQTSGGGLTTLPLDKPTLSHKLARAVRTHETLTAHGDGLFWFVLEDTNQQRIVGVSGIECAVGLDQACYTYRVSTIVHASKTLEVYHQFPTLFLTNDHSGCSELCSLYLHPDYRRSHAGALLSKARFLFMAQHPSLFANKVIAELRGYLNAHGRSPFWDGLGRHFFDLEFSQADYLTAVDQKQFIAELMPRYPFYTRFLPESAQAVIGQVHDETLPAKRLLEHEGFRYEGCVDIFDAGPTLECYLDRVRAVRDSESVTAVTVPSARAQPWLISNQARAQFCCTVLMPEPHPLYPDTVEGAWEALQIAVDRPARCVGLNRENPNG